MKKNLTITILSLLLVTAVAFLCQAQSESSQIPYSSRSLTQCGQFEIGGHETGELMEV